MREGQFEDAKRELRAALAIDPYNGASRKALERIEEMHPAH
jgi:hypothetical protein